MAWMTEHELRTSSRGITYRSAVHDKNLWERLDVIAGALPEHVRDEFADLLDDIAGRNPDDRRVVEGWLTRGGYMTEGDRG